MFCGGEEEKEPYRFYQEIKLAYRVDLVMEKVEGGNQEANKMIRDMIVSFFSKQIMMLSLSLQFSLCLFSLIKLLHRICVAVAGLKPSLTTLPSEKSTKRYCC